MKSCVSFAQGFVRRQIFQDDANLLVWIASGDHLFEKTEELRTGMPLGRLALHFFRLYVRCAEDDSVSFLSKLTHQGHPILTEV